MCKSNIILYMSDEIKNSKFEFVDLGCYEDEIKEATFLKNPEAMHILCEKEDEIVIQEIKGENGYVRLVNTDFITNLLERNFVKPIE